MEGLQDHAAAVLKPHPLQSGYATCSHASGQQNYDHIWKESTPSLSVTRYLEEEMMSNSQLMCLESIF